MNRGVATILRLLSLGTSFLLLILFMYVEWTYLRENFLQMLNPLLHLMVLIDLLLSIEFWILALVAVGGSALADKLESDAGKDSSLPEIRNQNQNLK